MSNFASGQNKESFEQATQPALCANGCGFFANATCHGLCSKCYRSTQMDSEQQKAAEVAFEASRPLVSVAPDLPSSPPAPVVDMVTEAASTSSAAGEVSMADASPLKSPTRCLCCRKKVGLTGFKCKCGQVYCGQHRYAEAHNCPFDYKSAERQKLAENNPVIQAAKVQKL